MKTCGRFEAMILSVLIGSGMSCGGIDKGISEAQVSSIAGNCGECSSNNGGVGGGLVHINSSVTGITNVTTGGAASDGNGSTVAANPLDPPSCQGLNNQCGTHGESCCTSIAVPGGKFMMGRSTIGTDAYLGGGANEEPEHLIVISSFRLDKFEVTVARMRRFLGDYDRWRGEGHPKENEGANPNVTSGMTGWDPSWQLVAEAAHLASNLKCNADHQTWAATDSDNFPINCINWYEAFAFCIWDGGRLPTEAEWEYAAAGGDANNLYPWGSGAPNEERANYVDSVASSQIVVGSRDADGSRWGHRDLAGSLWEWVLDWYDGTLYSEAVPSNVNVFGAKPTNTRSVRGGGFLSNAEHLRAVNRDSASPGDHAIGLGFRCARSW